VFHCLPTACDCLVGRLCTFCVWRGGYKKLIIPLHLDYNDKKNALSIIICLVFRLQWKFEYYDTDKSLENLVQGIRPSRRKTSTLSYGGCAAWDPRSTDCRRCSGTGAEATYCVRLSRYSAFHPLLRILLTPTCFRL
jgi:hypothetical protein